MSVKRIIIRLAGTVIQATVNVVYQIIVTYYLKDENDASFFSVLSPFATASDGRERVLRQYSKSMLSPGGGGGSFAKIGTEVDDWIMDFQPNRRVASDELLVMSVAAYKLNPGYGQITLTDQVNFVTTGRIYVTSAG